MIFLGFSEKPLTKDDETTIRSWMIHVANIDPHVWYYPPKVELTIRNGIYIFDYKTHSGKGNYQIYFSEKPWNRKLAITFAGWACSFVMGTPTFRIDVDKDLKRAYLKIDYLREGKMRVDHDKYLACFPLEIEDLRLNHRYDGDCWKRGEVIKFYLG